MKRPGLSVFLLFVTAAFLFAAGQQGEAAEDDVYSGTIRLQSGYPDIANEVYKTAARDFEEEHPNATINVVSYSLREHERKYFMAIAADSAPDLIETGAPTMQRFIEAGRISTAPEAITEYIDTSVAPKLRKFFKDDSGAYTGLPFFTGIIMMYWNKDMLADAGYSDAPENWQELREYVQNLAEFEDGKLVRSGISLRLSGGGSGVAEKFMPFLYQAGGRILEETDDGMYHAGYNNQAGYDALKLYLDILYEYEADNFDIKHDAEAFALERTAMFERGAWVTGYLEEHNPDLSYEISLLPSYKRSGSISANFGFYVPESSDNKALAWEFAKYLTKPEHQRILLDKSGWVPARQDIDYSSILEETPQLEIFFNLPENFEIISLPGIEPANEIQTALAQRLVDAFRNRSLYENPDQIRDFLAEAAAETNDLLRENDLYGE